MKTEDVREVRISYLGNVELPYRVEIMNDSGMAGYSEGETLAGAIMLVFNTLGLFPTKEYPYCTNKELARFIFWQFGGGENWLRIIRALTE